MEEPLSLDTLTAKLRLIGKLGRRLLHVKWGRDSLTLLGQVADEARQLVQDQPSYDLVAERVTRLSQVVDEKLAEGQLPQGEARQSLLDALEALSQVMPSAADGRLQTQETLPSSATVGGEILLLAEEPLEPKLSAGLEAAGFKVRQLDGATKLRTLAQQTTPAALIVDMDCAEGAVLTGLNILADERHRLGQEAPLLFISERGDLTTRLEAVGAGGSRFLTKPVDLEDVLETLNDYQLKPPSPACRVLIVGGGFSEAQKLSTTLEEQGFQVEALHQPLEVLDKLHHLRPDVLLLDVDLGDVNGPDLAKAIRQHPAFVHLPILLLTNRNDLNRHIALLGVGGDDLLEKPVDSQKLLSIIRHRLRHSHALRHELNRLRTQDIISGLYNRRYFLHRLQQILTRADATNAALMLITLDNLPELEVADIIITDDLVEQAARRLQAVLTEDSLAARLGDATFAVLNQALDVVTLRNMARQVYTALEAKPYRVGQRTLLLSTSIGVSLASEDTRDVLRLIQRADVACKVAREAKGERIHIHSPKTEQELEITQRRRLLDEVREALQHQWLSLVFQPIVSLRGDSMARYEVLLRIRNREGQELLPDSVFTVVQNHRVGRLLERWVISRAVRVLRERRAHQQPTTLFINVSTNVLQDEELINWLRSGFERTRVPPEQVVFEMTATAASEALSTLKEFVQRIRDLGCGFSLDRIDDQEVSRQLIKELPLDYVKLNGGLVSDLVGNLDKQEQLTTLVQEFIDQGITTIGGSIENLPTLYALWSCGVGYVQGYLLQRPREAMDYAFSSSSDIV